MVVTHYLTKKFYLELLKQFLLETFICTFISDDISDNTKEIMVDLKTPEFRCIKSCHRMRLRMYYRII